jgi:putative heme-binding domain-containing protein
MVALLDTDNAWQRDLAQSHIVHDDDPSRCREAIPLLVDHVRGASRPETRLQALWTLECLSALTDELLVTALGDPHPRVREQSLRLAERRNTPVVVRRASALADDSDAKVCLQAALSSGMWSDPSAAEALVSVARRFPNDPLMRTAVSSAALAHFEPFVAAITKSEPPVRAAFHEPLVRMTAGRRDRVALATLLTAALTGPEPKRTADLDALLAAMQRLGTDPWTITREGVGTDVALVKTLRQLDDELARLAKLASDSSRPGEMRLAAARLLAITPQFQTLGLNMLPEWLTPQATPERQTAALDAVGRSGADGVPEIIAKAWPVLGPTTRSRAIDVWLSRPGWTADLLERVARNEVGAGSLSLPQRDRLLKHPERPLAARAARTLVISPTPRRRDVVDRYGPALAGTGSAARGREVYRRVCATCHRHGNEGHEVGPSLAAVAGHAPRRLLINILDPNADIQPGYQTSTCALATGEVVTGVVASESGGSLTMKLADGTSRTISRDEIDDLVTSNTSFMPEGLEALVTIEQMRDLIVFLASPGEGDGVQTAQ